MMTARLWAIALSAGVLAAASPAFARFDDFSAQLEALTEQDLKTHYLHCSRAAIERGLAFGHAALCSMVYETLLQRIFGGDFDALLAWSRVQDQRAVE